MVLHALEVSLRDMSTEVVRQGRQITLRGLGPSQRTVNRNDITVFEVNAENNRTTIHADVTYQASALLGDTPQNDLVLSKLDRVFDSVKMQLGTRRVRVSAPPSPEAVHLSEPVPDPETVVPDPEPVPVVETPVATTTEPEEVVAAPVLPQAASQSVEPTIPVEQKPTRSSSITHRSEERQQVRMFQALQPERPKPGRGWGIAAIVVCAHVAVIVFFTWPYLLVLADKGTMWHSGSADVQAVPSSPVVEAKSPNSTAEHAVPDSSLAAALNASIHDEPDPEVWLESWASAMRSRDAAAQASFYADPVDRYFLKSNVSNADVLADKQTDIQSREDLWTFELKHIVIEQKPDSTARVRLVKHIISLSQFAGPQMLEQSIRSQLQLKRIDGQWKITSEQNLR
jgi:ketosteroid isomerase-like protein